jgi:hypothetical protein
MENEIENDTIIEKLRKTMYYILYSPMDSNFSHCFKQITSLKQRNIEAIKMAEINLTRVSDYMLAICNEKLESEKNCAELLNKLEINLTKICDELMLYCITEEEIDTVQKLDNNLFRDDMLHKIESIFGFFEKVFPKIKNADTLVSLYFNVVTLFCNCPQYIDFIFGTLIPLSTASNYLHPIKLIEPPGVKYLDKVQTFAKKYIEHHDVQMSDNDVKMLMIPLMST